MFLALFLIQLVIQVVLYNSLKCFLFEYVIKYILKAIYYTTKDINKMTKAYGIILLFENIGISIIVSWFTSAGLYAGITNLGASCILGLYMMYDVNKLKKAMTK